MKRNVHLLDLRSFTDDQELAEMNWFGKTLNANRPCIAAWGVWGLAAYIFAAEDARRMFRVAACLELATVWVSFSVLL